MFTLWLANFQTVAIMLHLDIRHIIAIMLSLYMLCYPSYTAFGNTSCYTSYIAFVCTLYSTTYVAFVHMLGYTGYVHFAHTLYYTTYVVCVHMLCHTSHVCQMIHVHRVSSFTCISSTTVVSIIMVTRSHYSCECFTEIGTYFVWCILYTLFQLFSM